MTSSLKRLAGDTAIYGLSSIVGRFLNYLLVPLYTRLFAQELYGEVTELYAYVAFFLILLTYGMETGFFRFAREKGMFEKTYTSILTAIFVSTSVFLVLLTIFYVPIANIMQYAGHPEYILWMGIIVAIDAIISIPFAKLRLENKAVRFATFRLISIGLNIGLNLFFLVLCPEIYKINQDSIFLIFYSPDFGIGYIFISNLISNIVVLLILLPDIFNVKYSFDRVLLKKIIIYSLPLLVAGFAGMINESLDKIMVKYLTPKELNPMAQLGIYGANYKLAILMTLFIQMFRYASEPFFFQNKEAKNAKSLYALATKYFIICGLFIFLGVMLYLDIIKYFIDSRYHAGLTVVPILLIANLFLGIFYNFSIWYKLNDMTKYGAYLAIFGAIITIVLNFVLVPIFGYVGAAWTTLVCYFLMTLLSLFWGQKYYKVPYDYANAGFYFILAFIVYFISKIFRPDSQVLVYVLNTVLLLIYFSIFVFKEKVWMFFKNSKEL